MKVDVQPKPQRKDLLTISIEGEAWRDLHIAIWGRNPKMPESSTLEEWKKAFQEIEYKRGKNYILRRLSALHYHSLQLHKLLVDRLMDPRIASRLIQECQSWGVLDDQAWLDSFIRSQRKRNGLPVILAKLKMKGFSPEILESIKEEYADSDTEKEAIQKLLQTKYRNKDLTDFPTRQKVVASLARKGFSFTSIKAALCS